MQHEMVRKRPESGARRRVLQLAILLCLPAILTFSLHPLAVVAGQVRSALQVRSASFQEGAAIPRRNTCEGANVSPELQWSAGPPSTRSFALIVDDPDVPAEFTHWLAYDIPADVHELAEGSSPRGGMPQGAAEGINSFGGFGYGGPCPPAGKQHRYVFRVFALDTNLALPGGASRAQLEAAMSQHLIAGGQTVGTYRRVAR